MGDLCKTKYISKDYHFQLMLIQVSRGLQNKSTDNGI